MNKENPQLVQPRLQSQLEQRLAHRNEWGWFLETQKPWKNKDKHFAQLWLTINSAHMARETEEGWEERKSWDLLEEWLNSGCASQLTQINWPGWKSYRCKASDHNLCPNSWLTTQLWRHRGNLSIVTIWILGIQQKPILRSKFIIVNTSIKKISKKQLKKMNPKRAEERI